MKKWAKLLGILCVFVVGITAGLAGCATVGNITNSYQEIIYNGNSAVMVNGYLYYGNSAIELTELTTNSIYNSYSSKSYLARVNTNKDLGATSEDYSPASVETVSNEVTGYEGNFMFVLGQNIYYATPNTQKGEDEDGEISNYFNYTCIYKSSLNGDNKTKLYTTTGEIAEIQVLKSNGTYYIVMLAGSKLIKINLSTGNSATLAKDVESVALPETYQKDVKGSALDWNGYVYYTVSKESEGGSGNSYSIVYKIDLLGGEATKVYSTSTSDIELIDRVGDVIFFTETKTGSTSAVYFVDVSSENESFTSATMLQQSSSTISDIRLIVNPDSGRKLGYIYTLTTSSSDVKLGYYILGSTSGNSGVLTLKVDSEEVDSYNILTVSGRTIYLSATSGIYKVEISELFNSGKTSFDCTEIVAMTTIFDGALYAFDGTYIYFYAQLEDVDDETFTSDDSESITDEDANYYLYRANVNKTTESYELLSRTSTSLRRS